MFPFANLIDAILPALGARLSPSSLESLGLVCPVGVILSLCLVVLMTEDEVDGKNGSRIQGAIRSSSRQEETTPVGEHYFGSVVLPTTPWFLSLIRQLRERVAPVTLPPLEITSHPVTVERIESLPLVASLVQGVRELIRPPKLPPLELTSQPVAVQSMEPVPLLVSMYRGISEIVRPTRLPALELTCSPVEVQEFENIPWYVSLARQIRETVNPPKLPPLELTSQPVGVEPMWAKRRLGASFLPISISLHVGIVASMLGARVYDTLHQEVPLPADMLARSSVRLSPPPPPGPALPRGVAIRVAPPAAPDMVWPKELSPVIEEAAPPVEHEQLDSAVEYAEGAAGGVPGGVYGGVPGGVSGGVLGGVIGAMLSQIQTVEPEAPPPAPKPVEEAPAAPQRISVPSQVQEGLLLFKAQPEYPALAKQSRIQGTVRLRAVITSSGTVSNIEVVEGHPLLIPAAIEAVLKWRYRPMMLNNRPVEVMTIIEVRFRLV